jgi:hypothetical protein
MRNRVCAEVQRTCRQHHYPPLQKTQGRGTLCINSAHEHHQKGGPPATRASYSKQQKVEATRVEAIKIKVEAKKSLVIPNRAESPVRNLLFSADEFMPEPSAPPAENRDGRGSLKLR